MKPALPASAYCDRKASKGGAGQGVAALGATGNASTRKPGAPDEFNDMARTL